MAITLKTQAFTDFVAATEANENDKSSWGYLKDGAFTGYTLIGSSIKRPDDNRYALTEAQAIQTRENGRLNEDLVNIQTDLATLATASDGFESEVYKIEKDDSGNITSKSSRISTLETDNTSNKNRISTLEDKYREATDTEVKGLFS